MDFDTQDRTLKKSAGIFQTLAKENRLKVPSRVLASAEFIPWRGVGGFVRWSLGNEVIAYNS